MRFYILVTATLCYFSSIEAFPTVVPDRIPCVSELETHFFAPLIVNQGLSLYNIRQELWLPINQSLQHKSLSVSGRMKRQTANRVPNPIEYPMNRLMTAKVLKEVLFEVFIEAMRENYADQRPEVDLIFDYIFNEQLPNLVKCFGPGVKQLQSGSKNRPL